MGWSSAALKQLEGADRPGAADTRPGSVPPLLETRKNFDVFWGETIDAFFSAKRALTHRFSCRAAVLVDSEVST